MDETDGWPDKICIQCVHQVSRCHAFKSRVEKSDQQLRQYIKGITVIVEEPITQIELPQQIHRNEIQLNRNDNSHHHVQVKLILINCRTNRCVKQLINLGTKSAATATPPASGNSDYSPRHRTRSTNDYNQRPTTQCSNN